MATFDLEPYKPSDGVAMVPIASRWHAIVAVCVCVYYGISAVTLPFTNSVWLGEIAPLAVLQVPKAFIKSVAQQLLFQAVYVCGLSHGSPSPDYIMTHTCAMVIMAVGPALLIVAAFPFLHCDRLGKKLIIAVLIFASIDALVTIWFDSVSSLKLYNASYF